MALGLELYECEIYSGSTKIDDFTLKVPILKKHPFESHTGQILNSPTWINRAGDFIAEVGYSGIVREGIFGGKNPNVSGYVFRYSGNGLINDTTIKSWYDSYYKDVFGALENPADLKYAGFYPPGVTLKEKSSGRELARLNSMSYSDDTRRMDSNFLYKVEGIAGFFEYALNYYTQFEGGYLNIYPNNGEGEGYDPITSNFVPIGDPTTYDNLSNPYLPIGDSQPGGGTGTFSGTSTPIGVPSLPSLSALETGFVTLFNPTYQQLNNLYNYLWTGAFDIDSFRKIFANPIDTIMGFSIVPFAPTVAGQKIVNVGNISTGVSMNYVVKQHYEFDFGSVTLPEEFGTYLDYEPYTNIELYLPYIGIVKIDVDDIRKNYGNREGTIQIIYHVDILSGALVAYIICNGTCCYQYAGSCLTQLPITGNDFTSMYQSIVNVASTVIGGISSGGLKGGVGAVLGNAGNVASNVTNMKPNISRSGGMGSTCGLMGVQIPYLIINQPIPAVAGWQNAFQGYPAHITRKIGTIIDEEGGGYVEFEKVYIDNVPCTDTEKQEILSLLEEGVIL